MNGSMVALPDLAAPRWEDRGGLTQAFASTRPPRHVHLIWSLSLGGAERIVADLAQSYSECGTEADLVLLRDSSAEHALWAPGITLHRLGALLWPERHARAAQVIRASGLPAFCHLMFAPDLAPLWDRGCRTVPVVHNASGGWRAEPTLFDIPQVPFVVACGDAVAGALRAAGLCKPVRVLRHVVASTRPLSPSRRLELRTAFGADTGTLLVGMAAASRLRSVTPGRSASSPSSAAAAVTHGSSSWVPRPTVRPPCAATPRMRKPAFWVSVDRSSCPVLSPAPPACSRLSTCF